MKWNENNKACRTTLSFSPYHQKRFVVSYIISMGGWLSLHWFQQMLFCCQVTASKSILLSWNTSYSQQDRKRSKSYSVQMDHRASQLQCCMSECGRPKSCFYLRQWWWAAHWGWVSFISYSQLLYLTPADTEMYKGRRSHYHRPYSCTHSLQFWQFYIAWDTVLSTAKSFKVAMPLVRDNSVSIKRIRKHKKHRLSVMQ